jgi:hypothetical protein
MCRFDTTKQLDGPSSCKNLIPIKDNNITINGWANVK